MKGAMFLLKKLTILLSVQRMRSIDLIKTYEYGTSKYLVSDKEEIKSNNIITRYIMMML